MTDLFLIRDGVRRETPQLINFLVSREEYAMLVRLGQDMMLCPADVVRTALRTAANQQGGVWYNRYCEGKGQGVRKRVRPVSATSFGFTVSPVEHAWLEEASRVEHLSKSDVVRTALRRLIESREV